MKRFALAAFAATLVIGVSPLVAPAVAQEVGVSIRAGDNPRAGVRIRNDNDVSVRRRTVIRDHDSDRGMIRTGSVGCRTVTIRKTNDRGDTVVKRIKKCG